MTEEDYEALGAHLEVHRATFIDACGKHGLQIRSEGRYPRLRANGVSGELKPYVDLWMEIDANGRHFQTFSPSLPYELSSGSFMDLEVDDSVIRFATFRVWLTGVPVSELHEGLREKIEVAAAWACALTKADLFLDGTRTLIRGRP